MCSRHSAVETTEVAWHHNSSHTVEFSRNRRPNHSSRNLRSDRLRPGVVRSCGISFCSCFALDLSRSSAFFAISALRFYCDASDRDLMSRSSAVPRLYRTLRPATKSAPRRVLMHPKTPTGQLRRFAVPEIRGQSAALALEVSCFEWLPGVIPRMR
jgi:hypothetical protein